MTDPEKPPAPDEVPFDPYRFGAPDVPPPPEYAPPGYIPPAAAPPAPGPQGGAPYAGGPYQHPYPSAPPGGPGGPPYPGQAPGPYPPYPPAGGRSNGRAVTGLVLGILSVVLFFTSFLDAVLVVLALIFSGIGLSESRWKNAGRGQAIAGLICAAVGAVLAIAFTAWVVHVSKSCDGYSSGSSAYERCLRDHL